MSEEKLSKVTRRQLQIFIAAVEHRNFIKAAEQLGLTPPAVSMQMSRLSDAFGTDLFEKDGRNIQPTHAATALMPYATKVNETLAEAYEVIGAEVDRRERSVSIGIVTTSRNFAPQLLKEFSNAFPDIDIDISISNRDVLITQLEKGEIDLAFMGRLPEGLDVEAIRFAEHPYVIIAHPEHAMAKEKQIRPIDLLSCKFIQREDGCGTHMVHEQFFKQAGLNVPTGQVMNSNANIKQAVMADLGIAFISGHTIDLECQLGKLTVLDVKRTPVQSDWYVVHRRTKRLPPAAKKLCSFIVENGPEFMKRFFKTEI
ncbi:LysR family transcriptional regulator [Terasakiella sp. A23]|uniref:LysR family transcriptional regulator n=1 Tax=Terasakiella sp. FCG-A23 TaxID=3080561 RepID=UPI0029555F75|nr:LysR family transcriptional regulator [Terasakiella sp. A23]MDV7339477.1 LysR family transcriptional regulator [Terasakiella sp. A23]